MLRFILLWRLEPGRSDGSILIESNWNWFIIEYVFMKASVRAANELYGRNFECMIRLPMRVVFLCLGFLQVPSDILPSFQATLGEVERYR